MPPKRHVITALRMDELSLVDKGAQEPGFVLIAKRDDGAGAETVTTTGAQPTAPPAGLLEAVDRRFVELRKADAERVALMKRARLTTETNGHTHLIEDGLDSGTTSGAETQIPTEANRYTSGWHQHPYVVVDGVVQIGTAMGHTHDVTTGAAVSTEKRAPAVKADTAAPTITAPTTTTAQETTMDPKKLIKAFAALTAEQVAHFRGLDEEGRFAFLEKSDGERVALVKAAHEADPVIHTTTDGREIRKSMDPTGVLVEMAKRAEAAEAASAAAVAKAARVELEKRAEGITKHLRGTLEHRAALVAAVEGIADPAIRKGAMDALASGSANNSGAFVMQGVAGAGEADEADPVEQMAKMANERAAATGETVDVARAHLLEKNDRYLALHKRAKAARA